MLMNPVTEPRYSNHASRSCGSAIPDDLSKVVTTAVVGPNSLFRAGLSEILRRPYEANKVAEAIESLPRLGELNLIVFIADAGSATLAAQLRSAKAQHGDARIVVMGDAHAPEDIWPLLVAGADGYLLTTISPDALRASLDAVMLGATVIQSRKSALSFQSSDRAGREVSDAEVEPSRLNADAAFKKLSNREAEILLCLTKGESNKHIARKYGITEATVKVHMKAILRKIRVSNRTQAAVWAQKFCAVHPGT